MNLNSTDLVPDIREVSFNSNSATLLNGTRKSVVFFENIYLLNPQPNVAYAELRVKDALFPNFFYNIMQDSFQINDVLYEVPDGVYNIYTLIATMNQLVSIQPTSSIYFSYNTNANRVEIVCQVWPSNQVVLYGGSLIQKLGFTSAQLPSTGTNLLTGARSTALLPPNLSAVTTIFIQSREFVPPNYATELDGGNYICKIPFNGNLGEMVYFNGQNQRPFLAPDSAFQGHMTISLLDQNGDSLDFQNYDWSITMEMTLYRNDIVHKEDLLTTMANAQADQTNYAPDPTQSQPAQQPPQEEPKLTEAQKRELEEQQRQLILSMFPPDTKKMLEDAANFPALIPETLDEIGTLTLESQT
jgi:hypothetical protein